MSSRVGGAMLALIAAGALALAVATPAWFAGHPTIAGHLIDMQEVHVGLLGAELCNTGGDGKCISRDPKEAFQITAFAELGVAGVATLVLVVLGLVSLGKTEKRKTIARVGLIATIAAGAGGAALLVLGPTDGGSIPLGYSFFSFAGATLAGLVACVLALQPAAKVKLRVADRPSHNAMPPGPQPVDMAALLGENQLHPSALGPEPRLGPSSPGGALPGPSGPLAPPVPGSTTGPAQPLFSSAPQLRPLYEAAPVQGGTGGLVPMAPKPLPTRAPTPMPRSSVAAITGMPAPSAPPARPRPKTLPPPNFGENRTKPASTAPPPGGPLRGKQISVPPSLVTPDPDGYSAGSAPTQLAESGPRQRAETPLAPPPPPVTSDPDLSEDIDFDRPPPPRPKRESALPPPRATMPPPPPGMRSSRESGPRTALGPPSPPGAPVDVEAPTARDISGRPAGGSGSWVATADPIVPASAPHDATLPAPRISDPSLPLPRTRDPKDSAGMPGMPLPRARNPRDSNGPLVPPPPGSRVRDPNDLSGPRALGSPTLRDSGPIIPPVMRGPRPTQPPALRAAIPMPVRQTPPPHRAKPPTLSPSPPVLPSVPVLPPMRADTDASEQFETVEHERVALNSPAQGPSDVTDPLIPVAGMMMSDEQAFAADEAMAPRAEPGDVVGGADTDDAIATTARDRVSSRDLFTPGAPPVAAPIANAAPSRPSPVKLPITTAPTTLPPPKEKPQQTSGPSPACPQCEAPMAWVEEHLRFYCKSCRMYF